MDIVIGGISAWEFHRSPPAALELTLSRALMDSRGIALPPGVARKNAPPALRAVAPELMGRLKGVRLPIHVIVDEKPYGSTPLLFPHVRGDSFGPGDLQRVAEGIMVTSPARTLLDLARSLTLVGLARLMFEACGIFACGPKTLRIQVACEELERRGVISPDMPRSIFAFRDEAGRPIDFARPYGGPPPWEPCFDKNGVRSDLWKRPPLLSADDLATYARACEASQGAARFRRAAKLVIPGSASPEESLFAIMVSMTRKLGGEGMPRPMLNRRIRLADDAARALGQPCCVGDATWRLPGRREMSPLCVEVAGQAFHEQGDPSERRGHRRHGDDARANALRASGIEVITVTHAQMADLAQWDMAVSLIADALDIGRPDLTPAFLRQRSRLRRELFGDVTSARKAVGK